MPSRAVRASIAKQVSDAWRLTAGAEMTNPLTEIEWYAAFWASDPAWSAPADGAAVSSWRNGGTLGTAATQGSATERPLFRASNATLGNKPVVDFVSSDYLEITSGVSLAQPFSIVWIGVYDTVAAITNAVVGFNSTNNGYRFGVASGPAWQVNAGTASCLGGTPAVSTGYMARAYVNGASSRVSVNGTQVASGDAGSLAVDQIVLGIGRTAPSTYSRNLDGQTAFLGIIAGDISSHAKWESFKAWVRSFYGLTIA